MTTITALPTPPSSSDPVNFNSRADGFLGALPVFVTETNTVAGEVQANATDAAGSAASSSAQAVDAAASASAAAASANTAALTANFKGAWAGLTGALAKPAAVLHNGAYWLLLNNLANVTTSQPGVTADWQPFSPVLPIAAISAATTAAPFTRYHMTAACTLTVPATPAVGTMVQWSCAQSISGGAIDPGAGKINGTTGAMSLNVPNTRGTLVYSGSTLGWI